MRHALLVPRLPRKPFCWIVALLCLSLAHATPATEEPPSVAASSIQTVDQTQAPTAATDSRSVSISWPNGDRYDGQMVGEKRQGQGRFQWANGQVYEGEWADNLPNGQGKLRFANGDVYAGEVRDGIPQGFGSKRFAASGDAYEGTFVAGQPDGSGTYADKAGNRYDGQWKAGLKQGKGKFQWANGQSYEGDWVQDQQTGQGILVFANGDRYLGSVRAGLPEGKGSKSFAASGDRYEGDFKAGEAHGEGKYLWKSGDLYQGQWFKGRKTGSGRYTWANGDYWVGNFADDHQMDGRLYFTPKLDVAEGAVEKLLQQTRAASDTGSVRQGSERALDVARLSAIPLVALELKSCARPGAALDCQQTLLHEIEQGRFFKHDWQTMFTEKGPGATTISYDVDRNSVSEAGRVFSWFRFLDASGSSRNTGIKYDCQSQQLEIQLLFNCTGGAQAPTCTLDRNFDKYVGRAIPAATIKGWFKSACDRRG